MDYDTQMARGRFLKSSRETIVTLPLEFSVLPFVPGWRHDEPVVFKQIQSSKSTQANPSAFETDSLENRF
jgi:hypothetical protein